VGSLSGKRGAPHTGQEGQGAFQDSSGKAGSFNAWEVFAPVSRFCAKVEDPSSIMDLLPRAIAAAQADPKGPAVLLLPKDVQQGLVAVREPALVPTAPVVRADTVARDRAVAALQAATGVLIIAGEGVAAAHARDELAELAQRLGAWVAVAPDAKDVFDNRDPRFVGVAGVMGHANVEDCLRRADVCLLVGTRLPAMARGGLDDALATTLVIGIGPELPFVSSIALGGDLGDTLRSVIDRLEARPRPCLGHAGPRPLTVPTASPGGRSYAEAVAAVEAALPEYAHVFVDAGNAGATAIHLLPAPRRGRFVVAVGMGGMGYTFGAGLGAAMATGQRTYVLAGDGAFFMHGMEVHTALEYNAPVTFVIFNNNAHAMCATREQLFYGDAYSYNQFRPADIAAGVAATFPTLAVTHAANSGQLQQALLRSNTTDSPAFVAMDFHPDEIPPFLPFLAALDQEPTESEVTFRERRRIHVG